MIQQSTLYTDIRQILPQIVQHAGISPRHPVYTTQPLYSKFEWGQVPKNCRKGEAVVYALPNRGTQLPHSLACKDRHTVSFVLGVIQDAQAHKDYFWDFWAQLKRVFGRDGMNFRFTATDLTIRTETIPTPWSIGKVGVFNTSIISESQPVNWNTESCPLFRLQMVVEWTFFTNANLEYNV